MSQMHHGWMEVNQISLLIKNKICYKLMCANQIFNHIICESEILACDLNSVVVDMRVFPHKETGRNSNFCEENQLEYN